MALITWNEKLSVNVAEIDRQHRELVETINDLTRAIKQEKANAVIRQVLSDLMEYAENHFKTEEKYFKQFGYPDAQAHIDEHAVFIRKISQFRNETSAGRIRLTILVLQFLGEWLINHIMVSDKAYAEFFNDHGLT